MPDDFMRNASVSAQKKQVHALAAINRPIPSVGIFDEPTRCYRINKQWARIVIGFTSLLIEPSSWLGATDESYLPIEQIRQFLLGVDCDMPIDLRQNPENDCQLQYSADGGETWILAFDYSLCVPDFAQTIINNTTEIINQNSVTNFNDTVNNFTENIYNNYVNNYVNSITDIAPELGYGDTDDGFRDAALCHAIDVFIDSVCDARIEYYENNQDVAQDLLVYLALATATIAVIGLAASGVGTPAAIALASQAGVLATGLGLGGAFYSAWYVQANETYQEQYEDLEARQAVKCCLLDNMKGTNVDRDDFIAAFSCTGLSENAQAIFDAANILAQEEATYAAFVENLRIGFNSARVGILTSCDCPYPSMIEYDFSDGNLGFVGNPATYNEAGYWDGVEQPVFPVNNTLVVAIIEKSLGATAKVMGIGFQYTAETNCGITSMGANVFVDETNLGGFGTSPVAGGTSVKRTYGLSTAGTSIDGNKVQVVISSRLCPPQPTIARIFKVRVWLHPESPIKGVEVANLPYGTGTNGTDSEDWWT